MVSVTFGDVDFFQQKLQMPERWAGHRLEQGILEKRRSRMSGEYGSRPALFWANRANPKACQVRALQNFLEPDDWPLGIAINQSIPPPRS